MYFMQLIQLKLSIIIILSLIMSLGCNSEDEPQPDDESKLPTTLILDGCIPESVYLEESSNGIIIQDFEYEYVYENDTLVKYGYYSISYENGLISRIYLFDQAYEEYEYNDDCQIIKSRRINEHSFQIIGQVDEKEYEYIDDKISKIIDLDDDETKLITYYPNSNNIDSIKTFNDNSELTKLEVFEYDEYNNIYKNLKMPKFDYSWWQSRISDNNRLRRETYKYGDQIDTIIYDYDILYNEFDFPIEINGVRNSGATNISIIQYKGCE